mgnify:FL=1
MKNGLILGFFDGVHLAHQKVISCAIKNSSCPILITLKNFNKSKELILTREESFKKIKALGVKEIVELDFSQISGMSPEEFLEFLKQEYAPILISTGFNYTFGKNRSGDTDFLAKNQEKFGYKYFCVPPLTKNGEIVSSTLIKNKLIQGEIFDATELLGSNFVISGVVKKGAQIGRTIGFSTANIDYPEKIVKIPYGVYSVKIDDRRGIMNWGMKPTVNNTLTPVAETHILDFEGDLYGQNLRIEVLNRIRSEVKFKNLDELKAQIKKDIEACLK